MINFKFITSSTSKSLYMLLGLEALGAYDKSYQKSCLYKLIGRSHIQYFDLLTILSDIQNAINSRPLTACSSDSGLEILTPNSFIKPNVNAGLLLKLDNCNIWDSDPPSQSDVVSCIQTCDNMASRFCELWYESYLLSMRGTM